MPPAPPSLTPPEDAGFADSGDTVFSAQVEPEGRVFELPLDVPVLLAAELAGFSWPSSCRNGTCRTCIRQLSEGHVSYRIAWPGLSAEEKQEGYILPCVAYAESDLVICAST